MGIQELPINKWARRLINPNAYPKNEWYRQHLERNFDFINFGDYLSACNFDYNLTDRKGWNFALNDQNLYWDFEILKGTFSILKKKGLAIFPIQPYSFKEYDKHISIRPYCLCIEPYYLGKNKIERTIIRILKRLPFLLLTPYFLTDKSLKRKKRVLRKYRANFNRHNEKSPTIIEDIISFCNERDICPLFLSIVQLNKREGPIETDKRGYLTVLKMPMNCFEDNRVFLNEKGKESLIKWLEMYDNENTVSK